MKLIYVLTVFKYEFDRVPRLQYAIIDFCLDNALSREALVALKSFISSYYYLTNPTNWFYLAIRAGLTPEACEVLFEKPLNEILRNKYLNPELLLAMAEYIFIQNEGKEKNILTMKYLQKISYPQLRKEHTLTYKLFKAKCFKGLFQSDFIDMNTRSYQLKYLKSGNEKQFSSVGKRYFCLYENFMIEFGLNSELNTIKDTARKLKDIMNGNHQSIHLKSAIAHGLDDIQDYLLSNNFCPDDSIPPIKLYMKWVTQAFLNDAFYLSKNNIDFDMKIENKIQSIKNHIFAKQLDNPAKKPYSLGLQLYCLKLLNDIFECSEEANISLEEIHTLSETDGFNLANKKIESYHFMPEIAQSIGNCFIFPTELLESGYIENLDKVFNLTDSRKSLFSYHHSEYMYEKRKSKISDFDDSQCNIKIVPASP
jgi:hypothetical protein